MNTRLVVNGYELDLSENIAVPLNLSITDVKNPENRKRSFSKTLTLEGTSNNMQFFLSAYALEMNIEQSSNIQYEPNKRYDCEFYKDDLLIFKGKFKLNHVTVNNGNYLFDCNLISDVVDIFTKLKDKKLGELNWSEYDHLLTRTNVINSWSQGIKLNGVDNRNFGSDAYGYQPKSYGYVYPLVDYGYVKPGDAPDNFRVNQLYPFVYVREAVQKCLNYALENTNIEIDYNTTFWSEQNTNLTKLIYGFGGGEQLKLNDTQINDLKVILQGGFPSMVLTGVQEKVYNNIAYTYVYSFGKSFNVLKEIAYTSTPIFNVNYINPNGEMIINSSALYEINFTADLFFNYFGDRKTAPADSIDIFVNGISVASYIWDQVKNTTNTINLKKQLYLYAGDKVTFQFVFNEITVSDNTIDMLFSNISINLNADKNAILTDGSPVSLSSAIPDIKCSEFLKGILNLFYAYLSDPIYDPVTNKSKIYIDSFINYYEDQNIYNDWTSIVDESQDITIQSNSLLEGNNYIYRFSEEKDYYNAQIKTVTGLNYGEKQLPIDTWVNGEVVFELPFNTYVPVKPPNKQIIYPIIIDSTTSDTGVITQKPYKGKGMLTFYNGLRSGVVNIYDAATDNYEIKYNYPFIHHMRYQNNTGFVPQFDLHFASRDLTFDDLTSVPSEKNTFDVYHKKFVNEITSIDSKLVTLYLKLNYKDINELNFATLKMIDGVLYRLNTIKDFDSDAYGTTEVELLKYLG